VTAEAIEAARTSARSTAILAKLGKVALREGPTPGASFEQGVLTITVTPALGVAGRPSSRRIEQALR
ncbi:MAG: hypothetical protein JWM47_4369, partial [Acidimicrobiales bacterium]|nr:hypothetical protein [Acidimicrobiales bacterium]